VNATSRVPPRRLFHVRALSAAATRGWISAPARSGGAGRIPCALGKGGLRALKREGDGATPIGIWRVRRILYRADRIARPPGGGIRIDQIRPDDGWCDAVGDRNYNRPVRHPYAASAERMWRSDRLYDIVVVLGHNDRPRIQGRGSAVFLHVARDDFGPTAGCVAVGLAAVRRFASLLRRGDAVAISRSGMTSERRNRR